MPRPNRTHVPGEIRHLVARGNRRQDIFESEWQWQDFMDDLSLNAKAGGLLLFGNILMTNHFHCMARTGDHPMGKVLGPTLTRFAMRSNIENCRCGHVFEGRYKSRLIRNDEHAKTTLRYIHRNPLRAGLVKDPAQWRWTSHRVYLGLEDDQRIDTSFMLSLFDPDPAKAREAYRRFMEDLGEPFPASGPWSEEKLIDGCRLIEREFGLAFGDLKCGEKRPDIVRARDIFIRKATKSGIPSLVVADFLGVDRSTVYRAQRR